MCLYIEATAIAQCAVSGYARLWARETGSLNEQVFRLQLLTRLAEHVTMCQHVCPRPFQQ